MEPCAGLKGHGDVGMIMAENEVIDLIFDGEGFSELHQRLIGATEFVFMIMGKAVALRPAVSQTEGDPWMQKAEKELGHAAVEHSTKEAVTHRNRPEAVTMTEAEAFSADFYDMGLYEFLHAEFLEI